MFSAMVSCMGRCGEGPTVVVYPDGIWYRGVVAADADELVQEHLLGDRLVETAREMRANGKPLIEDQAFRQRAAQLEVDIKALEITQMRVVSAHDKSHDGKPDPLSKAKWPSFDPAVAKATEVTVPVQVNGKLRAHFFAAFGTPKEELEARALAEDKVKPFLAGKQLVKAIVVPDKLVNLVAK